MEVISGIISGILILAVLVTFPLGLRARRRALKEVAQLGTELENKASVLVARVEALTGGEEARPPVDGPYRGIYIEHEPGEGTVIIKVTAEDWAYTSETSLKETLASPLEEFALVEKEQCFKTIKSQYSFKDVEEIIGRISGGWCYPSRVPQYSRIEKEHTYAE